MTQPHFEHDATDIPPGVQFASDDEPEHVDAGTAGQYELLLVKLARAERELACGDSVGRSAYLEAASAIVFDLLYSLDFRRGGELVPRLAALYGYIGNELLDVGRTRDREQLGHIRDMITTLRRSWQQPDQTA